jgi:hypothetical protein
VILLLLACSGGTSSELSSDVVSIRVTPQDNVLEVRTGQPADLSFQAFATNPDGEEAPLDLVSWTSSNLSVGEMDPDGWFQSVDSNGGVTEIVATHLGVQGSALLTVVYRDDLVLDGLSQDLAQAWPDMGAALGGPEISYPESGVRVPRNVEGLPFIWDEMESGRVYRLRFQSAITDISVFTVEPSYSATSALWAQIAAANRSGLVQVSVTSAVWDGTQVSELQAGFPIEVQVDRLDARGSVLYWASSERGILRLPFGSTEPELFWEGQDGAQCVGCHTVSGDDMVVSHDGINGVFSVVDISDPSDPVQIVDPQDDKRFTFKTVSPDGRYILGAGQGRLTLYNLETGGTVGERFVDGYVTMPDWSPDGQDIAMVRVKAGHEDDWSFEYGEIIQVPVQDDGQLGVPEVLVASDGQNNLYYPAYSPDGAWVAYNRAQGAAYANVNAQLWVSSRDGQIQLPLDIANQGGGLQNSYPRWGPLPDDDVLWLAFSSKRQLPWTVMRMPQIWLTAIDPALLELDQDPSSPAFWLPGQDVGSDNHLPVWAEH